MNQQLKLKLNELFQLKNKTKIKREKLNTIIDELEKIVIQIENPMQEYIPVKIILKFRNEPLIIHAKSDDLYDFQDWIDKNQANIEKWKYEKYCLDDIKIGSVYEIFRSAIQYIEWPFVTIGEGQIKEGKFYIDFEFYNKIKAKNKKK